MNSRLVRPIQPGRIFLSHSTCPRHNLAYEQWLFAKGTEPEVPVLYIYRNRPSVIIGRNQNPWTETTPSELAKRNIMLMRRHSGGGAVYHDEGNTNYCIMLPSSMFSRPANAKLVLSAVHALGVTEASLNERNDIYVGPMRMERCYHHGTMLLTTPVDQLKATLVSSFADPVVQHDPLSAVTPSRTRLLSSRGVESVRSPVQNLFNLAPDEAKEDVTHEGFTRALSHAWRNTWDGDASPTVLQDDEAISCIHESIRKDIDQFQTWDWVYGQTPTFEAAAPIPRPDGKHNATYTVEKGRITKVEIMRPEGGGGIDAAIEEASARLLNEPWDAPKAMMSP